ncbi:MAG TPA: hypothetical protein VK920_09930 [Solirubrobacterales bacterium]|nr:hypothetical protein [Solirubrobacterales bacterium]
MPRRTALRPIGLKLACAVAISLTVPALAGAKSKTVGAELRVVGPDGQSLAELIQYTGTVRVPTDPDALCFGQGSGGSGARVKLPGSTALGAVQDASATDRDLRPLSLTDAFDFGLGVCGIGGLQAQGSHSWYLKHNHAGAQLGGDQLAVKKGDEVLWYLAPSFPYPPELRLEVPARAGPGSQVDVEVVAYADDGGSSPAAGATISGGESPATADAQGGARVDVGSGDVTLRATRGADIPSNEARVCVADSASECSAQQTIAGTVKPDKIKGTKFADKIKARGRNDRVKARGGGPDRVNCGSGKRDVAIVDPDDTTKACEKVRKK